MASVSSSESSPMFRENNFMINTMQILDEETENVLSEILKCDVCLELPKGKQVRICEKGHHFCFTCHNKMNFCGICRGNLLQSRNFVVEELVTKLGAILGLPDYGLPPAEPPVSLRPGSFSCPHGCSCEMPAFRMLSHIRNKHKDYLVENVRSNPYSGKFSFSYIIPFKKNKKYLWSMFVTDMGLFTFEVTFLELDFFGSVSLLGDDTISSLFRHKMLIRMPTKGTDSFFEFSVSDCPISNYKEDMKTKRKLGHGLSIKGRDMLERTLVGSQLTLFISIWKKNGQYESRKKLPSSMGFAPERHGFFNSERKSRRNRSRNMRKKRLKKKKKTLGQVDEVSQRFSAITL